MNNMQQFIEGIPKVELHLHIEGSFEPELMFELAKRNNISIPFSSVSELREAYKFNNLSPMVYKTSDYGASWTKLVKGFEPSTFVRVVREDRQVRGLLYAGTEAGLFVSFDDGQYWQMMQVARTGKVLR